LKLGSLPLIMGLDDFNRIGKRASWPEKEKPSHFMFI
jgi:hypothetical protein